MFNTSSFPNCLCRFRKLFKHSIHINNTIRQMATSIQISDKLKEIFSAGVQSVQAKNLFQNENFYISDDKLTIDCNFNNKSQLSIDVNNKRCHLVGFGKAVYGMASECSRTLGSLLKSGIINVPVNTIKTFPEIKLPATIEVHESANNNLPDSDAECAALKIIEFIQSLGKDDVLFVLVSGGGSALLPLPPNGVTLDEKLKIIKSLGNKGASINDLNRVRIDLSRTKGGKLIEYAKNVSSVIGFIVSDIVGDPIHLIASGPTIQHSFENEPTSMDILKKFQLWQTIPESVQNVIKTASHLHPSKDIDNITNVIIANNETAVNAVLKSINDKQMHGVILSTKIEGNIIDISQAYYALSECIVQRKGGQLNDFEFDKRIESLRSVLCIDEQFNTNINQTINQSNIDGMDICVIGAGEPTVNVTGHGFGGRNQELALRFSRLCYKHSIPGNVWLLSAGTDGIDGPTTAAGAIGGKEIFDSFLTSKAGNEDDIDKFIDENDSFNFYTKLCNGQFHILTGHTGTNVMDLHLLYFK